MKKTIIYVEIGDTLQSIIDECKSKKIEDLSKIFLCASSISCHQYHGEGEYCYSENGYTDLRFET